MLMKQEIINWSKNSGSLSSKLQSLIKEGYIIQQVIITFNEGNSVFMVPTQAIIITNKP